MAEAWTAKNKLLALGGNANAEDIMEECATSADHVYLPDSGAELKVAFKEIAQDISSLRLSR